MILSISVQIALGMVGVAALLNLWRLLRGPTLLDRVIALDTMYINTIALLVALGIHLKSDVYFEAALVLAMLGFITTVAFCKYALRGDIIE
ncbi:MAG: K+/H+ antiporter subunit F [Pseudomonadota bacterium]